MKSKKTKPVSKTKESIEKVEQVGNNITLTVKKVALTLFYTAFAIVAAYAVLLFTAMNIPVIISFILGGLGFSVTSTMSNAEYVVAFCTGIFLTLCFVKLDCVIIRVLWKIYSKLMKTVFPKKKSETKEADQT